MSLQDAHIWVVVCDNCKRELHVFPKLTVTEVMKIRGWKEYGDLGIDLCNICNINPQKSIDNINKVVNSDGEG
jgi:hypothetical protein